MKRFKVAASALAISAATVLLCGYLWRATAADSVAPEHLHWPVPAGAAKYGAIDGKHLWQYVVEQAGIARQYRDNGHPQFWGRFAGTSADDADVQWLLNKYRQIGLTDAHAQTIKFFAPQWSAQSWSVTATSRGQDVANSVSPTGLWQPRDRREGVGSRSRLCRAWQRSRFRGP